MTSVKEFRVDDPPTPDALGRGSFVFTDDYSVFDWGQMPDTIPRKGASLCVMGAYNFERLDANHIPTHYRGVVNADGDVVDLGEVESPPVEMAIDLTQVPDLPFVDGNYDYDAYHEAAGENFLVPLEVVFRNTVPIGSSLRDRGTPAEYGIDTDLDSWPDETIDLPHPVVEFSTKYEEGDRYLDREEARTIAGKADLERIEELALAVNHLVTEQAQQGGFEHQDGKIEVLYHEGAIKVADVLGTFDENRFSYEGQQVSKEVVRQYYKHRQPTWPESVKAAKAEARERDVEDWKQFCDETPDPLPEDVLQKVSDLYTAGANAYVGAAYFDAPPIDEAVDAVRAL